jgi:hypothetical protein
MILAKQIKVKMMNLLTKVKLFILKNQIILSKEKLIEAKKEIEIITCSKNGNIFGGVILNNNKINLKKESFCN